MSLGKPSGVNWIQLIISGAGILLILAAVVYFLGRLYIDQYYRNFGISMSVLVFSPDDYMFYSYPNVMMVVGALFWIWVLYRDLEAGQYSRIDPSQPLKQQKLWIAVEVGAGFLIAFGIYFWYLPDFTVIFGSVAYTALLIGWAVIGFVRYSYWLFMWILEYEKDLQSRAARAHWRMVFFLIIVLILLPPLTSKVANLSSISDFENLSHVTVVSSNLPPELQSSSIDTSQSLDVRLLTINDGIVYLFKATSNTDELTKSQPITKGEIYAIKVSDIQYLVYHNRSD